MDDGKLLVFAPEVTMVVRPQSSRRLVGVSRSSGARAARLAASTRSGTRDTCTAARPCGGARDCGASRTG